MTYFISFLRGNRFYLTKNKSNRNNTFPLIQLFFFIYPLILILTFVYFISDEDETMIDDVIAMVRDGDFRKNYKNKNANNNKGKGKEPDWVESDTDDEYSNGDPEQAYYDPLKPTGCFDGCAGAKAVSAS